MFGGCKLSQIVILLDKEPTSQSRIRSPALLVGEPLAKPEALQGLPRPLLQGEVALRSNDGEVARRETFRKTWCKTEAQDVVQPLSRACGSPAPLVGEPLAKPEALQGLPRPLLQGEVELRSNDGEVAGKISL